MCFYKEDREEFSHLQSRTSFYECKSNCCPPWPCQEELQCIPSQGPCDVIPDGSFYLPYSPVIRVIQFCDINPSSFHLFSSSVPPLISWRWKSDHNLLIKLLYFLFQPTPTNHTICPPRVHFLLFPYLKHSVAPHYLKDIMLSGIQNLRHYVPAHYSHRFTCHCLQLNL